MQVRINGTLMNLDRVLRSYAPHRDGGVDFRADDIMVLEDLKEAEKALRTIYCEITVINRMGWRFLLYKDEFGNRFPYGFAPLSGKLEVLNDDE